MGYRKISSDLQARALELLNDGWSAEDVADVLDVSERSIHRWERDPARCGDGAEVARSVFSGRPRSLNAALLEDLHQLITESPSLYLDEAADYMAVIHNTHISKTTVHNNLRHLGFTYKQLQRTASERDEAARQAWRTEMATHFRRNQFVFVDESSKDGRTLYRRFGRAVRGTRPSEPTPFRRGVRWSILPALTEDGYIAVRIVEGSIDGGEFYDFIVNDVLPKMNPYPQPRSILIMDNCAIHKSNALRDAAEAAGILLKFLPPYSPDLNPIEESFSTLKYYLRRHWRSFRDSEFPAVDLAEACITAVTAEKAQGWIRDCGYL